MKLQYTIDPELKTLGIDASVAAELNDLTIRLRDGELDNLKREVIVELLALEESTFATQPILASYRKMVQSVGRSPKRFPPAAQSLIEQVRRNGTFPTVNTAVDSYNLVAARSYLALGAHDMAKVGSMIRFRLSNGEEPFVEVGSTKVKSTQGGDYVYADEHRVLAWLDSKDSNEVKLDMDTQDMVLVIQGAPGVHRDYNRRAAEQACELITRFCGGTFELSAID